MKQRIKEKTAVRFDPDLREKLVEVAAQVIRTTYINEQTARTRKPFIPGTQWDGGLDRNGATRISIWPRVAKLVLSHGIDPTDYVKRQAAYYHRLPRPDHLLDAEACLKRYYARARTDKYDIQARLTSQQTEINQELGRLASFDRFKGVTCNKLDRARQVVLNPRLALTDLFRYCLARDAGLADLASSYHDSAVWEYLHNRFFYNQIWEAWLPADFQDEVDGYMRSFVAQDETT